MFLGASARVHTTGTTRIRHLFLYFFLACAHSSGSRGGALGFSPSLRSFPRTLHGDWARCAVSFPISLGPVSSGWVGEVAVTPEVEKKKKMR